MEAEKQEINEFDESLALTLGDDFDFMPNQVERQHKFQEVLKTVLPYLGSDEGKIILAEIMIALKLEGLIGKSLTEKDAKMVKIIREAIMKEPKHRRKALRMAYKLLR